MLWDSYTYVILFYECFLSRYSRGALQLLQRRSSGDAPQVLHRCSSLRGSFLRFLQFITSISSTGGLPGDRRVGRRRRPGNELYFVQVQKHLTGYVELEVNRLKLNKRLRAGDTLSEAYGYGMKFGG